MKINLIFIAILYKNAVYSSSCIKILPKMDFDGSFCLVPFISESDAALFLWFESLGKGQHNSTVFNAENCLAHYVIAF